MVVELPVRLAVEYPVGPADDDRLGTLEEAVLARPSDQPVEAPSLEEVLGAEVAPPLVEVHNRCLLYTSPSPRDQRGSRMPSSA